MGINRVRSLAILPLFMTALAQAQMPQEIKNLQWGIKNNGEPQRIAIDHYTSSYIAAVANEDIHLPTPVSSAQPVIVAVLDTGIDAQHPALKDHLAGRGYNFVANNEDTADLHGHGTHVSGIILSVSPNARILPVKVVQSGPNAPIRPQETEPGAGTALTEAVAKGIEYAIDQGAEVINLSLAWPASIRSAKVDQAVARAEARGVIIVSSAGNDSTVANVYPCIYPTVICVGAHGPDGKYAYFSNHGPMVDLLAPGIAILSTWPIGKSPATFVGQTGYEFRNGTSMAAPFVTGSVAELLARRIPAPETKLRLLLSSRPIHGGSDNKFARYGKVDVTRALATTIGSWIAPSAKAPIVLTWDGTAPTITTTLHWKNFGNQNGKASIAIAGKKFIFNSVVPGATVETPIAIKVDATTESSFLLTAVVNGRPFALVVQIRRILSPQNLAGTTTVPLLGFKGAEGAQIRSVVAADQLARLDLLRVQPAATQLQLQLVQGDRVTGESTLDQVRLEQLLNVYRLPDATYALIFTAQDEAKKTVFDLHYFDSALHPLRKTRIGTDVTVLSESFRWVKTDDHYNPLWVAPGYTPQPDQPAYDPWNPHYRDKKLSRIYFVREGILRALKLGKSQIPLQVLPDGSVLVAEGDDYAVHYSRIRVESGKIKSEEKISLSDFQMLIGLPSAQTVLPLDGAPDADADATVALTAPSSPGNLRVTGIGPRSFDQILSRSSQLEALVQVNGVFSSKSGPQFFAQTHYDLRFFDPAADRVLSTSLNRYSYIPSMIFSRNFFPLVAGNSKDRRMPAIYVAASVANANISEIIIADSEEGKILKPAALRIEAKGCVAMGNFIQATSVEPAQLVFVCGSSLVKLPATIRK